MQFSLFFAILVIAITIACLQEVSAAPTGKHGLSKRRVVKKRAAAAAPPLPGAPGATPPVCPDPKNPQCPLPAPAPPVPPPPPPAQGVAIPGVGLTPLPDLGLFTAGIAAAPGTPDPAAILGGVLTSQVAGVGSIVPGVVAGVQGAAALGAPAGGGD